ncbi:MAG: hypothetical protein A2V77_06680 [Anaeromyxobacter sp. RBG_16_69_14]|nr:MAG: hypothetical protein A2V77_06680 [Anaeromyxobacter sp. RBG_16_69_14]
MRKAWTLLTLAALLVAGPALAQGRGRTDGPEGSEIGKGGYSPSSGAFSLQLDGGGAFTVAGGQFSPPLFIGATATYWGTDYYRLDLSGAYVPGNDSFHVWEALVGPSFRAMTYPLSFSAGLQAGAFIPSQGDTRFILSPRVGVDFLVESNLLAGLNANYDITLGDIDLSIVRVYLSVGYRF